MRDKLLYSSYTTIIGVQHPIPDSRPPALSLLMRRKPVGETQTLEANGTYNEDTTLAKTRFASEAYTALAGIV